jgi:hypothetical protein
LSLQAQENMQWPDPIQQETTQPKHPPALFGSKEAPRRPHITLGKTATDQRP